ncbi:uncharacterized protein LOC111402593 [Olea europaea var. sylvestris]|uniref:uncharacterized protein LOC111402593 n=1 Tax=Olea europaea var. sylvestris TaxID=158386 RepID=UPI000C1D3F65|nr:uncharacterized protein LOC111402593 [Olea europaea var. sylvestris]
MSRGHRRRRGYRRWRWYLRRRQTRRSWSLCRRRWSRQRARGSSRWLGRWRFPRRMRSGWSARGQGCHHSTFFLPLPRRRRGEGLSTGRTRIYSGRWTTPSGKPLRQSGEHCSLGPAARLLRRRSQMLTSGSTTSPLRGLGSPTITST